MRLPQPFQYQGSKRGLASVILRYLPPKMGRLIEPFAGSAAISIFCAARRQAREFWLNDLNRPLTELLNRIINQPEELADAYREIWSAQKNDGIEHYYRVRESFNRTQNPDFLLYLMARCVKGSIRYNSEGLFNQSPDKRRQGTHPATMRGNIMAVSRLLHGNTIVTSHDYQDVLASAARHDVVYMDPPYQGVCGERDARYFTGISFDDYVASLDRLNQRGIRFAVSYDGRSGGRTYGQPLPLYLNLTLIELEAGRSSQATLLGRNAMTVESLYLSAPLAKAMNAQPRLHRRQESLQVQLF